MGAIAAAGTTTLRGTSVGAAKKDMLWDRSAAMAAATITMESTRRAMVRTADRTGGTASLRRSRQTPTESQTRHNVSKDTEAWHFWSAHTFFVLGFNPTTLESWTNVPDP